MGMEALERAVNTDQTKLGITSLKLQNNKAKQTPEPTAAAFLFTVARGDSLVSGFVGAPSPAVAARLCVRPFAPKPHCLASMGLVGLLGESDSIPST
jgi:hypothetical protein